VILLNFEQMLSHLEGVHANKIDLLNLLHWLRHILCLFFEEIEPFINLEQVTLSLQYHSELLVGRVF
jgi:hypothetical protein